MTLISPPGPIFTKKDALVLKKDHIVLMKDPIFLRKDTIVLRKDTIVLRKDHIVLRKVHIFLRKDIIVLKLGSFILQKRAFSFLLTLLLLSGIPGTGVAQVQNDHLLDSLKKAVSGSHSDAEKLYALDDIANYYTALDSKVSNEYAMQAMQIAELSRDRKLIALTYLRNGHRHLNMSSLQGNLAMAKQDFQNAEKEAKDNDLDVDLGFAEIGLARCARGNGDYATALNYNHQAVSVAASTTSDSLKVAANNSLGMTYRYRNEKLLAFRSLLEALNIAELSKKDDLLRLCYTSISDFYGLIEDYDKAIDYEMKIMNIDLKHHSQYNLLDDYNNTGKIFTAKKQTDLALAMYERSIALADSLQYPLYKMNSYLDIANMYFNNDDYAKGMDYLNSHREIMEFFTKAGLGVFFDEGFGSVYSELGKMDSAFYFFKRAEPVIEKNTNPFGKYEFYRQFGDFYKKKGDYKTAIDYYLKGRKIGQDIKDMTVLQNCAKNLDTLYDKAGDFKQAYFYNAEYNLYKDSIRSLAKETDLLKLEVDNDNRRRERQVREDEENTQRRHNVQYMGFTAGLAGLFIILVMLGFFMVSPRTIRALGFFSFIFLFEFIILLADKQIHEWTHGEPWKILLIKIFLAAILLPLHHWLEHKVIHYLNSRKKIAATGWSPFGKKRPKGEAPTAE